jgi:predicted transcriptional regulator
LAGVSGIDAYCVLGKNRLLTVVKTFKTDLEEGDNPKTMSELFAANEVSCDDFADDTKVTQFINDVDIMVIMEKFDDNNIDENKVKTVIENHRHYNKLVCKLSMVVKNDGDVNDYLDAVVDNNWETIRALEGRATGNNANAADTNENVDPPAAPTPAQVVEEVKTYISEKKGFLQSNASQENNQYSPIIALMEQLEAEINRLNAVETTDQPDVKKIAA